MQRLRFAAAGLLTLVALATPAEPRAQAATRWTEGIHSRAKLVAGGPVADGKGRWAGVVIGLDPGFKTYWRHPGESGLPPAFDWSRSTNLADAEVLWPAPTRFEDASGVSYGYAGRAVFPVRVTAKNPAEPVRLALKLDYGVCKDLCIPAQATLTLDLASPITPEASLVAEALARVPQARPLGTEGVPAILDVAPADAAGKPVIEVAVAVPAGSKPQLFVEAPDGWYLAARDDLVARPAGTPGSPRGAFIVDVLERPKSASGMVDIRLTLVAGSDAVESRASLDSDRLPR